MKKSFALFLFFLMGQALIAQTYISENQAKAIASSFASASLERNAVPITLSKTLANENKSHNVFIYNIGNQGYVIVSGNTALPPVLGYSNHAPFPSLVDAPENFTSWIQHYSDMIDFAVENNVKPEPEIQQQWDNALKGYFPTKNIMTVNPLITTHWNQDCFYNE